MRLYAMLSSRPEGRSFGWSFKWSAGWFIWLIIAVVLVGASPDAMAQAVDTTQVQEKSVGDLVETMQQWKIVLLSVSLGLVIMLLFAGGLLRPGGLAPAGLPRHRRANVRR